MDYEQVSIVKKIVIKTLVNIFTHHFLKKFSQNTMVTHTTIVTKTDTLMLICTNLQCLKSSRSFYYTSGMPLMKEWYMKCKTYMRTRMFFIMYYLHMNIYVTCYCKLLKISKII
jgi:hypothetical protein